MNTAEDFTSMIIGDIQQQSHHLYIGTHVIILSTAKQEDDVFVVTSDCNGYNRYLVGEFDLVSLVKK